MKLFITTLGRSDNQVTLGSLVKGGLKRKIALVVQSHEWGLHRRLFPQHDIISLPSSIKTLGPTRRFLCEKHPKEKIVLLDDDLLFYCRPNPDDWHLKYSTPEQLELMFNEIEEKLEKYAHVSVSAREGNNTVPEYWVENCRYMRFLAYNTALFPKGLQVGRVDGMSDFDLNLQLLRRGYPNCVFFRHAQGHGGTQTPGGCSLNRTHASHEAEIKKMLEWHAPFVAARKKVNKTGGEFGTRTELTVYWKKAFESSSQQKTPAGGRGQLDAPGTYSALRPLAVKV